MFFAELVQRQECKRVFENLHRHEELKQSRERVLWLVALSIGCNERRRVSGSLKDFHFSQVQILPSQHVH